MVDTDMVNIAKTFNAIFIFFFLNLNLIQVFIFTCYLSYHFIFLGGVGHAGGTAIVNIVKGKGNDYFFRKTTKNL